MVLCLRSREGDDRPCTGGFKCGCGFEKRCPTCRDIVNENYFFWQRDAFLNGECTEDISAAFAGIHRVALRRGVAHAGKKIIFNRYIRPRGKCAGYEFGLVEPAFTFAAIGEGEGDRHESRDIERHEFDVGCDDLAEWICGIALTSKLKCMDKFFEQGIIVIPSGTEKIWKIKVAYFLAIWQPRAAKTTKKRPVE